MFCFILVCLSVLPRDSLFTDRMRLHILMLGQYNLPNWSMGFIVILLRILLGVIYLFSAHFSSVK